MPLRIPDVWWYISIPSSIALRPGPRRCTPRLPRNLTLPSSGEFTKDQGDPGGVVVDAMVQLLQLAVDEGWSIASAGSELSERISDEVVLHRVRTNVSRILSESSSAVIERAAAIVEGALGLRSAGQSEIDHIATCGWPYASLCPRCYPLAPTIEGNNAPSLN
jgi:hypothetical protein